MPERPIPTVIRTTPVTKPNSPASSGPETVTRPGFLVVDKPAGWTSHDVVGRVRRLAGTRKVGHAGTLDPMATGILVVGIGPATRLLGFVGGADKDYEATVRLGIATVSDDSEGEVTAQTDASGVSDEAIEEAISGLRGEILQVPSAVSAIKVDGRRSYARVRAGEKVELEPRPVTVSVFRVASITRGEEWLDIEVAVTVSSGTYVRALARDLGIALGVGGHLTALRRTRLASFSVGDAHALEALVEFAEGGTALPILSLAEVARTILPNRTVTEQEADELSHGRRIAREEADGYPDIEHPLALLGPGGHLVALAIAEGEGALRPSAVLTDTTMGTP